MWRALGDSWDVRTSLMLNRFSGHAAIRVDGPLSVNSPSSQSSVNSAKQALLAARAQGGPDAIVQLLAELTKEEQLRLLQHMKAPTSHVCYADSVVDSGSSKHLHTQVQVTHSEDLCSISGFESNTKPTWTQGDGYLPLTARDTVTGQDRPFDVGDSDKLNTVALDILSLGKLFRAGWSFYFESADKLVAVTPDKQSRFRAELGDDDILRHPHKLRRFYTCSSVCIPRQKRKQLAGKGFIGRAEVGRLMGFRSPFSSTYRVLLSENRVAHNISVTFDDSNCTNKRALPSSPPQSGQLVDVRIGQAPSGATEEERGLQHHSPQQSPQQSHLQSPSQPSQHSTSQFPWQSPVNSMFPSGTPQSQQSSQSTQFSQSPSPFADSQSQGNATVQCHDNPAWQLLQLDPLDIGNDGMGQYFDLDNPHQQAFWYQDETVGTRAARGTRNDQPSYVFLTQIEKAQYLPEMDRDEAVMRVFDEMINPKKENLTNDDGSIREGGMTSYLAMLAMKDIQWKQALQGDDAARIISSFHDERDSLLSTVLTLVEKDDPEYDKLYQMAVTGRYLFDLRRNEAYKIRGVKQGFKDSRLLQMAMVSTTTFMW